MVNDRGTTPRGGVAAGQPPSWPQPTGPAGRRVPTAPRERRPALAALALLLIAGGALGAGSLIVRAGRRVPAIEISRTIGPGQRIPASAMREVHLASGTGLPYVPWSEASQVARYDARHVIPAGTLLTRAMVGYTGASTAGKDVVGLALKDGQFPAGLQVGDRVDVFQSQASSGCPGTPGDVLATDAVVLSIAAPSAVSGTGATEVTVALAPGSAGWVACSAANGVAAVAVLPRGATPATTVPSPAPPVATSPARRGGARRRHSGAKVSPTRGTG